MATHPYRALIVDDEAMVRNLTARALTREGFSCDLASDGQEGGALARTTRYDVVVTDLRMPNRHGHALSAELLALADRPLVVILTGVLDAALAKDLLARGVDSIEFKPVAYDLFAAKVLALVKRRRERKTGEQRHGPQAKPEERRREQVAVEDELSRLSEILPMSSAAREVYALAASGVDDVRQIAAAVARDASLAADTLRIANSALYNPGGMKIDVLDEAVARIGRRRIGELAMRTSAAGGLAGKALPWMRADLAWRRSIAAGVAADVFLARASDAEAAGDLFLSAIMHPLGRIALGTIYPQQYRKMVEACVQRQECLDEHEQQLFPLTPGQAMSHLLRAWNIPEAVHEPLKYISQEYFALATLPEPMRTKAELLKLAILIGWIAVGEWEPWDRIELPPGLILKRFGLESVAEILEETRSDYRQVVDFQACPSARPASSSRGTEGRSRKSLRYRNLSPEPFDFLVEILPSLGVRAETGNEKQGMGGEGWLVNSVWTLPEETIARLPSGPEKNDTLMVTDAANVEQYDGVARVVSLPCSHAALRLACASIA